MIGLCHNRKAAITKIYCPTRILHPRARDFLIKGIAKGALTADQVESKFAAWEADKANKVQGKIEGLSKDAASDKVARLKAEADANAAKAKAIEAKNTPEVEEAPVEEAATEVEATEEAPATEESTDAPAEESAE